MKMKSIVIAGLMFFSCWFCQATSAQTTTFTFQGGLNNAGAPANGNYDSEPANTLMGL